MEISGNMLIMGECWNWNPDSNRSLSVGDVLHNIESHPRSLALDQIWIKHRNNIFI
jgi:hypothetical protein